MRGVITMNEEYETRFLCNTSKVRMGPRQPGPVFGPVKAGDVRRGGTLRVTVSQTVSGTSLPFQALSMRIKLMAAGGKQPKLIGQNEVEPVALATQVTEAVSFEPWSSKGPWALSEKESGAS